MLSGHNGYWVPDWSPVNSNEKEKKRKNTQMQAWPAILCKCMRCYLGASCFTPATFHRVGAVNWNAKQQNSELPWSWRWPTWSHPIVCAGERLVLSGLAICFPMRTLVFTFVLSALKKRSQMLRHIRKKHFYRETQRKNIRRGCSVVWSHWLLGQEREWALGGGTCLWRICCLAALCPSAAPSPGDFLCNKAPFRFLKC